MPINNDNINLAGDFDAKGVEINFSTCKLYMQKIKFSFDLGYSKDTQFFLKILQRNSKLIILGNLSIPGHTNT